MERPEPEAALVRIGRLVPSLRGLAPSLRGLALGAMVSVALVVALLTVVVNASKYAPLADLRIATRWGMFSAPPRAQPMVVVGLPYDGGPPAVLFDPNAPDRPWRERLRDVRERKLADNAARIPSIQQAYLDYHCRHADVRAVRLVALAALGLGERVVAERTCDRRGAVSPVPSCVPAATFVQTRVLGVRAWARTEP